LCCGTAAALCRSLSVLPRRRWLPSRGARHTEQLFRGNRRSAESSRLGNITIIREMGGYFEWRRNQILIC
jgi:hypothetical protein